LTLPASQLRTAARYRNRNQSLLRHFTRRPKVCIQALDSALIQILGQHVTLDAHADADVDVLVEKNMPPS